MVGFVQRVWRNCARTPTGHSNEKPSPSKNGRVGDGDRATGERFGIPDDPNITRVLVKKVRVERALNEKAFVPGVWAQSNIVAWRGSSVYPGFHISAIGQAYGRLHAVVSAFSVIKSLQICIAKIVKEQDVKEYVEDLRAKFYGALEDVLIAVTQYVKNGKDGGRLGYRMLVDAGVIPQKDGKRHPAMEPQKPADPQPDSEQRRIRMIATEMVRRGTERQRFFAEPLEMEETEEEVRRNR